MRHMTWFAYLYCMITIFHQCTRHFRCVERFKTDLATFHKSYICFLSSHCSSSYRTHVFKLFFLELNIEMFRCIEILFCVGALTFCFCFLLLNEEWSNFIVFEKDNREWKLFYQLLSFKVTSLFFLFKKQNFNDFEKTVEIFNEKQTVFREALETNQITNFNITSIIFFFQ